MDTFGIIKDKQNCSQGKAYYEFRKGKYLWKLEISTFSSPLTEFTDSIINEKWSLEADSMKELRRLAQEKLSKFDLTLVNERKM